MKREIRTWTIRQLQENYPRISFPEYQRQSNVWSIRHKERLIDSLARGFDISTIYLYEQDAGIFECIDGRQRLSSLAAFFGFKDSAISDQDFAFEISNEVIDDTDSHPFSDLAGKSWSDVVGLRNENPGGLAARFHQHMFDAYELTVVVMSELGDSGHEFNLQFSRLNLGIALSSGERLNAMVGELRDACFGNGSLGEHDFLKRARIPTRRFAQEQLAAQILVQAIEKSATGEFTRARLSDLMDMFKRNFKLSEDNVGVVGEVRATLDWLEDELSGSETYRLRNRASVLTVVLVGMEVRTEEQARVYKDFVSAFFEALSVLDQDESDEALDSEFVKDLEEFRLHMRQASVERSAVAARYNVLQKWWGEYKTNGGLPDVLGGVTG